MFSDQEKVRMFDGLATMALGGDDTVRWLEQINRGVPVNAIARQESVPESTVRARIRRARAKLSFLRKINNSSL